MSVKLVIREEFEIDLCDTEEQFKSITVRELKERIAERKGAAESEHIILCDGENLEDDRRLSDYGVKHKSILDMRRRVRGGASPDLEPGAGGMGENDYRRKQVPESEQTISFDSEKFGGDRSLSFLALQHREKRYVRRGTPKQEPEAGGMGDKEGKNRSKENLLSL